MSTIDPGNQQSDAAHLRAAVMSPSQPHSFLQRPMACILIMALLIAIGLVRIISTYHVFNATIDEGAHVACGMQWLQDHVYTYDLIHTPLARISVALLPYLDGVRNAGNAPSYWQEGVLVLSSGGRYWHTLTLARIGVLPYFVLATIVICLWTRRVYGSATALLAAGIFTMLPIVLAHSAVATTDIPLTAFFITATYAFTRWLSVPNWRTAAVFGIATGLSIATKLSTVVFLPATMAGILLLFFFTRRRTSTSPNQRRNLWGLGTIRSVTGQVAIGLICAFLVVWATYRFSHAPINKFSSAPDKIAARVFGPTSSAAGGVQFLTATLELPAPELYNGVRDLRDFNRRGRRAYLFGQLKQGGWRYFYPVAIAVKTPLAVLLLAIIGSISLAVRWYRERQDWQQPVPLVAVLAILASSTPERFNIGVRHVMPVFAFLSMLAAVGVVWLWNSRSSHAHGTQEDSRLKLWAGPAAAVILLAWFMVSSALAHPDYLSYFNEFGGRNPADILIFSDVDWGQDLTRLSTYLSEHQVKHVSIAYDGYFDAAALGLPETVQLKCGETATGWVAVEERRARVDPECVQSLTSHPLKAYVGKTMRVYYIPGPADGQR